MDGDLHAAAAAAAGRCALPQRGGHSPAGFRRILDRLGVADRLGPGGVAAGAGAGLRFHRPAGAGRGGRALVDRGGAVALPYGVEFAAGLEIGEGIDNGALQRDVALPQTEDQIVARELGRHPGDGPAIVLGELRSQQRFGDARVKRLVGNAGDKGVGTGDDAGGGN